MKHRRYSLSHEDSNLAGMKLYSFHDKVTEPRDQGTGYNGKASLAFQQKGKRDDPGRQSTVWQWDGHADNGCQTTPPSFLKSCTWPRSTA